MNKTNDIWDKLQNLDRRILYWLLFIGLMIPLITPIGLPISISPTTASFYQGIKLLKPGQVAILNLGSESSAWSECLPGLVATTKALIQQNVKIVVVGPLVDSSMTWNKIVDSVPAVQGLTYGKDYVFLGYYTGGEAAVARMATSLRSIFPTDSKGTPLDNIEMMKNIDSAKDINIVISSDSGDSIEYWIRQWFTPFSVPVGEVGISMLGSSLMPYYRSGTVFGISAGIRGGAELEKLIGQPAAATKNMDSISLSHLMVIVAVILANIGYFIIRSRGGK
jgi:hypothetical protein